MYTIAAWNSEGYIHDDEHYQIVELANYKLGHITQAALPWEYSATIRSGLQPLLAFSIFSIAEYCGVAEPYILAFLLRFITAIFAVVVIRLFSIQLTKNYTDKEAIWHYAIAFLLWFMPFLNVRFSSEIWGGLFFVLALYTFFEKSAISNFIIAGLLMGFSFLCRFQMGFMILGLLLWMVVVKKEKGINVISVLAGVSFAVLLGVFIDKWLYGKWTLSCYNYFVENIVHDRASYYGTAPWYMYFKYILVQPFFPVGIVLLISLLVIVIKEYRSWPVWVIVMFLLGHIVVPHKELRFLFPLIYFIPVMLMLTYKHTASTLDQYWVKYKIVGIVLLVFISVLNAVGLVAVSSRAAGQRESITHFIARQYPHQKIDLIYTRYADIYTQELPAQFYKIPNAVYLRIDSVGALQNLTTDSTQVNLFACLKTECKSENIGHYKKVYQSMPKWVEQLGVMTKTVDPMQVIALYRYEN